MPESPAARGRLKMRDFFAETETDRGSRLGKGSWQRRSVRVIMYCRIELKVREGADALLSHEADLPVFTEDNTALSSTEFPSPSRHGDNGECRGALWNSLYTSLSRGRAYSLRRLMHIPKGSPQCRLDPLACFDPSGAREKGGVGSRAHPFVLRGVAFTARERPSTLARSERGQRP